MDEKAWDSILRAFPHCLVTIGAYSDWLQENSDPRWEPYQILVREYKSGFPGRGPWYEMVATKLKYHPLPLTTPMIRAVFVKAWVDHPDRRAAFEEAES